jgi:hypothetical protein
MTHWYDGSYWVTETDTEVMKFSKNGNKLTLDGEVYTKQ